MKNKQKKTLKITLIIISIAILLIAIFLIVIPKPKSINNTNTQISSTSGGSSGTTETDVPSFKFPTFNWDFTFPCIWNCEEPDSTDNLDDFTFENCRIDSDCENICSNPTYARCISGDCSCTIPTTESPTCFDSDLSLATRTISVYEILGTTESTSDRTKFTDYCSRGNLIEYSCRNGLVTSNTIDCKTILDEYASCYNGECVTLQ